MPSITKAKIIHCFLFSFNPGVTEAQKGEFFKAAKAIGQIPGIMAVELGPNIDNPPYEYTGVIYHTDDKTRAFYVTHPTHRYFVENYYRPLTQENRVSCNTNVE